LAPGWTFRRRTQKSPNGPFRRSSRRNVLVAIWTNSGHAADIEQAILIFLSLLGGKWTSITVGVKLAGRGFASDMRRKGDRMIDDLRRRSAAEVFEDHLRLAGEHRFEEDIQRNVSPDIVVLERRGIFRGHNGVRELARLLEQELPGAPYVYTNRLVEGRVAFLEWTAQAEHSCVSDGADSFLIEDGWIVAQTIHYTVDER
jgi:hypothetical protein